MSPSINPLLVIQNYLGEELSHPHEAEEVIRKLSEKELSEFFSLYHDYEKNWQPPEIDGALSMHIGRAHDTIGEPLSWLPRRTGIIPYIERRMNVEELIRKLIYIPKVSIWMPAVGGHKRFISNSDREDLAAFFKTMVSLKTFIDDGSICIVPDQFYADTCEWSNNDKPSAMLALAREEAKSSAYRDILGKIDFYQNAEDLCSDSAFIRAMRDRESIMYINPLNEINEDMAVQALIGSNTLCSNNVMKELISCKFSNEAVRTGEMSWNNISLHLPRLNDISLEDLKSVRKNEEAFHTWRTSLSSAIRSSENILETGLASSETIQEIFQECTLPASLTVKEKVKSKTLKSAIGPNTMSFLFGAIAAYAINPEPGMAVSTGALSSSLKVISDVLNAKKGSADKSLFRLYSLLKNN